MACLPDRPRFRLYIKNHQSNIYAHRLTIPDRRSVRRLPCNIYDINKRKVKNGHIVTIGSIYNRWRNVCSSGAGNAGPGWKAPTESINPSLLGGAWTKFWWSVSRDKNKNGVSGRPSVTQLKNIEEREREVEERERKREVGKLLAWPEN